MMTMNNSPAIVSPCEESIFDLVERIRTLYLKAKRVENERLWDTLINRAEAGLSNMAKRLNMDTGRAYRFLFPR